MDSLRGGGRRLCPALIGRDDLLALAGRRLAAAGEGTGQLLLLAGEAGIGKTRLLGEIVDKAAGAGFAVTGAAAFPGDVASAGGVLTDLATDLGRDPSTVDTGTRIAGRLR